MKQHRGLLETTRACGLSHLQRLNQGKLPCPENVAGHHVCGFCWLMQHPEADIRYGLGILPGGRQKSPDTSTKGKP